MTVDAGARTVLDDAIAQELLEAPLLARFSYVWLDGTPRVIPIWFHWDGKAVVLGTQANAPKVKALQANPAVAVTIDGDTFPYKVLNIRGRAAVEILPDIAPEYVAAAMRYFGPEQGQAWASQLRGNPMARIRIVPEWANILDFQTRFPSAMAT